MNTAPRVAHRELAPQAFHAITGIYQALAGSTLGKPLIDLIYLRVSQINGCSYCVDLHARDLLKGGEDVQRINSLLTWHEVSFFTDRERAALNWAESLTNLAQTHAPDADFEALKEFFTDKEIVELTLVAGLMNLMNRVGVGFRVPVTRKPMPEGGAGHDHSPHP